MQEGIDRFEIGEIDAARAKLDALLGLDPTNEEAFRLRQIVGEAILAKMATYVRGSDDLGKAPAEILRRARIQEQQKLLDPEYIRQTVRVAVQGNTAKIRDVAAIGQYAVPELVNYLRARVSQNARVNASYILSAMGPEVVAPLCEALYSDDGLQKQGIIQALLGIRPVSPRLLAPLKRLYENKEEEVAVIQWAGQGLKLVTNQEPGALVGAADYCYSEANRYYLSGPDVTEEINLLNETLWLWNQEAQALQYRKISSFALAYVLSEKAILQGIALAPEDVRFPVLLSSLYYVEKADTSLLSQMLAFTEVTRPDAATALQRAQKWMQHTLKNDCIAEMVGPDLAMSVLYKALSDGKAEAAVGAIGALEKGAQWDSIQGWRPAGAPQAGKNGSVVPLPHPLEMALRFPDKRIRVAAANCLVRIGYPPSAKDYALLLPLLVEGSKEVVAPMLLVISHDPKLRDRMDKVLSEKGVQPLTAPSGREGVEQAMGFPPKDAILIDGDLAEFAYIQARLDLMQLVEYTPLPLVIITSPEREDELIRQFPAERFQVEKFPNPTIDDAARSLYVRLHVMQMQETPGKSTVAILTHPDNQTRARIKQLLQEEAQRQILNPSEVTLSEDLTRTGAAGLVSTYVNIFLDDELSGYDAMRTVLDLQASGVTRPIPIGILVTNVSSARVRQRFSEMLKDPGRVRLIEKEATADQWLAEIRAMQKVNPLSNKNYVRQAAEAMALHSAKGASHLDANAVRGNLTDDQIVALKEILRTRTEAADDPLRIAVAQIFGHLRVPQGLNVLQIVVEEKSSIALREAALRAIGAIDADGLYRDFKVDVLQNDPDRAMQEAAAWALSVEKAPLSARLAELQKMRVGYVEE
ncbi:MAG: HEAT repeat domain-containing protein [Planctomycetota bacterium]